jgi:site-specific DNA-cytosine methylase
MKAIGLISGVGSLLVGAKRAGFKIVGNVEPRPYYRVGANTPGEKNTFEAYFKAPIRNTFAELDSEIQQHMKGAELAMLHNECGNGSSLSFSNKNWRARQLDEGDFPWVFEHLQLTRPQIFVLDNLAPSLKAIPPQRWIEEFPNHYIYPFPVDNARYGNPQRMRTRTFFIGVHKDLRYVPVPGEVNSIPTTRDVIGDLQGLEGSGKFANHERHVLDRIASGFRSPYPNEFDRRLTWREIQKYVLNEMRESQVWPYYQIDNTPKVKIGVYKGKKDGGVNTLNGGLGSFNPWTGLPFSLRERARIQGFPDDFILYGARPEDDGKTWDVMRNGNMTRQMGKAMPLQWGTFVAKQIAAFYKKQNQRKPSGIHHYQPPLVTEAKQVICESLGGYGKSQARACEVCWVRNNCRVLQGKAMTPGVALREAV